VLTDVVHTMFSIKIYTCDFALLVVCTGLPYSTFRLTSRFRTFPTNSVSSFLSRSRVDQTEVKTIRELLGPNQRVPSLAQPRSNFPSRPTRPALITPILHRFEL
jgi:hypothetical protein